MVNPLVINDFLQNNLPLLQSPMENIQNLINLPQNIQTETAQPALIEVPSPQYRNARLEKKIAENKEKKELSLRWMHLTDADMEIVAYYVIRKNKVI
ncbi:unnamed protein product [Rotaria sordida]|uniref:Uncharacterized protein n=1 Tax=Rotaria sordida TaxID=392033 RepID=A0A815EQQ7_9BILA|nr:unnamed protein product [Rotaria sordida]